MSTPARPLPKPYKMWSIGVGHVVRHFRGGIYLITGLKFISHEELVALYRRPKQAGKPAQSFERPREEFYDAVESHPGLWQARFVLLAVDVDAARFDKAFG